MRVGWFALSWAKLKRRKLGFIWFVVIKEKDMCGFTGGCVASFQSYLVFPLWMARMVPSKFEFGLILAV